MYELCINDLRQRVREAYPALRQRGYGGRAPDPAQTDPRGRMQYLLWMCGQVAKMDDLVKATSWIAWMHREAEVLGLIPDNIISRDLVRRDKKRMGAQK